MSLALAASTTDDAATIRRLTCFDTLTGLPNRVLFREQLGLAIRIAQRNKQPLAVLLADIDDFRRIKNTLGHRGSDDFIRAVAQRIGECLRDSDLVSDISAGDRKRAMARLDGNEFALVLNGLHDPHDAQRVAQRLREAVALALEINGVEVLPTMSIGVAIFPGDGKEPEALIECADIALGRAKDLGKDRVLFYSQSMNSLAAERLELESDLRRALDEQQLFPVYQPRVDSRSGRLQGMEALVRWRHPERGVLQPGAFIEASEQSRLIVPIGDFMLEAACQQNKRWQTEGLPHVPVGVNVSPLQVSRSDFVHNVARALERSGLPPACLELEITESVMMGDAAGAQRTFSAIRAMGVRIAIDDFGTGFSSLSYLRDFPFDMLKIDRSFVADLPGKTRSAAVTGTIIDLARRLDLEVVAEGVETADQRAHLLANGCHWMQGYLFSRPIEPAALAAFWRRGL